MKNLSAVSSAVFLTPVLSAVYEIADWKKNCSAVNLTVESVHAVPARPADSLEKHPAVSEIADCLSIQNLSAVAAGSGCLSR
jgi:hypothetical protein